MELRDIDKLSLDGGCLTFDFVNTVADRINDDNYDYIEDYERFLAWSGRVKMMSSNKISRFAEMAAENPVMAREAIARIRIARETTQKFFTTMIQDLEQDKDVLDHFNRLISNSMASYHFDPKCNCICLTSYQDLASPLNLIFVDAFEIIKNAPRERLKICEGCGWLFYDTTKNGRRRWCNSLTCGSLDKARRYYHRQKAKANE